MTARVWAELGGPAGLVGKVSYMRDVGDVLPARLPVREWARASVGVCSLAAAELLAARNGTEVPSVRVSEGAVATAFHSERVLRMDGRAPVNFAPLSGFWRTADGWVRTHANYPHHRARLLAALGISDFGSRDDRELAVLLADVLARRSAEQVQERVYGAGGLAVAWVPGQQPGADSGHVSQDVPLVETRRADAGSPGRLAEAALPAEGVRVLDLTRVLAGPVAARTLGLLGADVLRVDSPHLPEDADTYADTGMGKRSTLLDLADSTDRQTFEALLTTADVVLSGYRPGALDSLGLNPHGLHARVPGLVVAELRAWHRTGPWAGRRGFDSLVQVGSGITAIESEGSREDDPPGTLPAQALDHSTGYLVAAGVLRALTKRRETGYGSDLRYSLAGTASWLMRGDVRARADEPAGGDGQSGAHGSHGSHGSHGPSGPYGSHGPSGPSGSYDARRWTGVAESPYGRLEHALPPVSYEGAPTNWACGPGRWGADRPEWLNGGSEPA